MFTKKHTETQINFGAYFHLEKPTQLLIINRFLTIDSLKCQHFNFRQTLLTKHMEKKKYYKKTTLKYIIIRFMLQHSINH